MGRITIDEALINLEGLQKDYQDFHDEVWRDPETYSINAESLSIAIETLRKYRKIFEDYEELTATLDPHDAVACSKKIDDFCIENMRGIIGEYYADRIE